MAIWPERRAKLSRLEPFVRDVKCPKCGSRAGAACRTGAGNKANLSHDERFNVARMLGKLDGHV